MVKFIHIADIHIDSPLRGFSCFVEEKPGFLGNHPWYLTMSWD